MASGDPRLTDLARIKAKLEEHREWLELHDERLDHHEKVLAEVEVINREIELLSDIASRSRKRAVALAELAALQKARKVPRRTR